MRFFLWKGIEEGGGFHLIRLRWEVVSKLVEIGSLGLLGKVVVEILQRIKRFVA